jgi:DNA-binding response OmpR family regulator
VKGDPPDAGKRLLVADDDPAIRRLFEVIAKRERIGCDSAANGAEAVAASRAATPGGGWSWH